MGSGLAMRTMSRSLSEIDEDGAEQATADAAAVAAAMMSAYFTGGLLAGTRSSRPVAA
jgi:hypothetical protein